MTFASDRDLAKLIQQGVVSIDPPHDDEERTALVQPASIDLRLGTQFRVYRPHRSAAINPAADTSPLTDVVDVAAGDPFMLQPMEFALATTFERVRLNEQVVGFVEGKSSLGRLGLQVHVTAGLIDPNFYGTITLELVNVAPLPIMLWPGMAIAQLAVSALHSASARPYGVKSRNSSYQGQTGPTASRSHVNFRIWNVYPAPFPAATGAAAVPS